jgi:hypothetical protein
LAFCRRRAANRYQARGSLDTFNIDRDRDGDEIAYVSCRCMTARIPYRWLREKICAGERRVVWRQ